MAASPSRRAAYTASAAAGGLADGDPRAQLAELQRARVVAAATDAVAELGYGGLTVSEVIARAKISRRTFYEIFADRDECFLAAFEVALARVAAPVAAAYHDALADRSRTPWRAQIAAGLETALATFDEQPALARLLVVESLAAAPPVLGRRAAVVDALVRAIDGGRDTAPGRPPGPLAGEAVVGAVLAILHSRLLERGRREPLLALAGPLMNAIVLPYLGPAAAARELERPAPATRGAPARRARARRPANPLHGLDMRLTYRTMRVLSAIGELGQASAAGDSHERPSNRAVADAAGIADAGQMSKLLARLEGLGLIRNTRFAGARRSPYKGEPNQWTLTSRGVEVIEALRDRPGFARQG